MDNEAYTNVGYAYVWIIKCVFIPLGVAITARIIADKLLQPQPQRQRKKRLYKNRFK